jgi:RNA polymerase sigma factor (sigma-70 family)
MKTNKTANYLDDKKVWSAFKSGDHGAFEQLYKMHSAALIQFGFKVCANASIVEDALQDLYVDLWDSRENLTDVKEVRFYLMSAMRYKILAAVRKRKSHEKIVINENFSEAIDLENRELQKLHEGKLIAVIEQLPARQKEVVFLHYYMRWNNKKIAEYLLINYQSVANLLQRSLAKLRLGFNSDKP